MFSKKINSKNKTEANLLYRGFLITDSRWQSKSQSRQTKNPNLL